MNAKIGLSVFICLCLLGVCVALMTLPASSPPPPKPTPTPAEAPQAGPEVSLVGVADGAVTLEFRPADTTAGLVEAELHALDGKLLAKGSVRHAGKPVTLRLAGGVDEKKAADYYVRYRLGEGRPFRQRSLFFLKEILETTVLAQRDLVAGTSPVVRVLVRDRAAGRPVASSTVTMLLTYKDRVLARTEAKTNLRGEVAASLKLPDLQLADANLKVAVKSRTGEDAVEQTVRIRSATRTLLSTDKPLYQPGQTIHIRALSLGRSDMSALRGAEVIFEVDDAKGNKVFKRRVKTDAYGISHADFVLGDELNKGTYRIRAIVAKAKEEKTVTVQRYVLPKFKVNFKTDRRFYQPGETVKVDLQTDYFFGKPVAGAKVQVKCAKFDVAYVDFQTVSGKTDKKGHYAFQVKLPSHFVGQPLEAGKASAKFDLTVTDTADHKEQLTRNVVVTGSPIIVAAVPESGRLIDRLENRIYVVTTYADATPAHCDVTWTNPPGGEAIKVRTDAAGFAQLTLTPKPGQTVSMSLSARDAKGAVGKGTIALKPKDKKEDDSIVLRTDKSIYRVGQPVTIAVGSTRKKGPVYVDLIKDRQTHLTRTLELADGKADDRITLDAGLSGTVQVNAYLIGANGVIVRDRRLILVDPADDLRIAIDSDKPTYLPAGEAKVAFRVTDKLGRGVASALGVMVVDEAVFALQEMQPGLEKVYFYLEKEIATPRYEIHGYSLNGCIPPPGPVAAKGEGEARRDAAARVLLASAKGVGDYSIHVNTHQRDNKSAAFQVRMWQLLQPRYAKVQQALAKYSAKHRKDKTSRRGQGIDVDVLIAEGFLAKDDALDPWGWAMKITGRWCVGCQTYHGVGLTSAGIDGQWGTADDVTGLRGLRWLREAEQLLGEVDVAGVADAGGGGGGGIGPAAAVLKPAPMHKPPVTKTEAKPHDSASAASASAKPIRIRQYFPETLYFNPAVITDGAGKADLTVPLADSITTWRLTCMANSAAGQLGSSAAGIRVFQDFFVDIDFPVALTQNDEVHVPVALYNYLKSDQEIRLTVKQEDWFELRCAPTKSIRLGPSEVRAVHFPIIARKIGYQKFTVTARGAKKSDAVARSVEIAPDGKEYLVSHSGRLEKDVEHTITIPAGAIEGAGKVFVKVYPGTLSQVVEGLDKMLRMPFGCFEQTSSVTYPNILVLDYMKTASKITPAIQMKAQGFINAGYQRLLAYEVRGGGFEWFGNPPAHRILTAFGLMEFHDMSKVHEVDPAVISRTQRWLAKLQEADGSYKPSKGGIREGAIDKFTDDVFRITAYITWALSSTGYRGPQVDKGVAYLRKHLDEMKDNYTIALTANAFATVDPKGKTTLAVLEAMMSKHKAQDDVAYWPATSATPTHGRGSTADIEVTALAVQALVRCAREPGTISKAVSYLAKKKDAYGTWQSTQATIQALRAMLMAERDATAKADAQIAVLHNGKTVQRLKVDKDNSDVLQLVDLKELTRRGDNTVALKFKGEGSLLYQIVGRYYLPYPRRVAPAAGRGPLTITVDYDRAHLATEDILTATATATWNQPGKAEMVVLDLGLPPGFTLIPDNLTDAVKKKAIEKYSTTGRQIIVYLRELASGKPVNLQYQLRAKYPLKAKTAKSVAYQYYNPDVRAEAQPVQLLVTKDGPGPRPRME